MSSINKTKIIEFATFFIAITTLLLSTNKQTPTTVLPSPPLKVSTKEYSYPKIEERAVGQPKDQQTPKNDPPKQSTKTPEISVKKEIPYYLLSAPNDPGFSSNWANSNVQASRAWDLTTGSSSVTVAVIDTGFALNHQDLSTEWATNSGELGITKVGDKCWTDVASNKKTNNCDDDNNGYIDDWRGYDFYNLDNSPQAGETNPTGAGTTHATMVSGVVAATANNSLGGAGIDQQAKILPLQVFNDDGDAYTSTIVSAISYATSMGVKVINLSLGTNQYDSSLFSAIVSAQNAGVVVVAASGNCALNDQLFCNDLPAPGRMTYPALYPNVIAVGATTSSNVRSSYSSYGPQLDLVAPGSSIGPLPVYDSSGAVDYYATASGTSFASPLVAGIASLLIAQNPGATVSQIETLLTESVTKPTAMAGLYFTNEYGVGSVNAHRATLIGLAKTQVNLLGTRELSPREPSNGAVWRAASGNVASDESILVGCRISPGDICSSTLEKAGTILRFNTASAAKSSDLQYMFIKGSDLSAGSWTLAVQNRALASSVATVSR